MKKLAVLISFMIILSPITVLAASYALFPPREPEIKEVPIIMYHLITKNTKYQGKFGISPDEMNDDLKYLKENGYETIFMSDLIKYVKGMISLPEKPVILAFDDGYYSDYDYLFPLLKEYEMKAVLSIVGKFTDDSSAVERSKSPNLTWEQLRELHKSKNVEIQSHSYYLHDKAGCGRRKSETMEAYRARLRDDLYKLQEKITIELGRAPSTFTYPLGIISKGSEEVLRDLGFQASFSCRSGMNEIRQGNPDCLFRLKRNIRQSGQPISSILDKLEKKSKYK